MTNLFTCLSNWKVKYICALLMFVCVGVETACGANVDSGSTPSFTSTSGSLDTYISYEAAKAGGTNAPFISSSKIRLYRNTTSAPAGLGGTLTVTATGGARITSITFTISSSLGYSISVDGGVATTGTASSITKSSINATSVTLQNYSISQMDVSRIQVTYTAPTPCTITWHVNSGTTTAGSPTTNSTTGSKITTLPTAPTSAACDGSKVFVGWTETPIVGTTNTKPSDLFTTSAGAPTLTQTATHYYAVFANQTSNLRDTTVTETFENQSTSSTFNSTQTYGQASSNAKIGWVMYYGTNSSLGPLVGSNSAQMRHYKSASSNYPYIKDTTQLLSLSKIKFKAKVGNTGIKMDVSYSSNNGTSWTKVGNAVTFANTNAKDFLYDIPGAASTKYIIKIGVNSGSTTPTSTYNSFQIDNIAFTYKIGGITNSNYATSCCTELGTLNGSFF